MYRIDGRFQGFFRGVPHPAPNAFQSGRNEIEIGSVFSAQKHVGRAGEIRTRGLLVPTGG